jgi:hypothetical protein
VKSFSIIGAGETLAPFLWNGRGEKAEERGMTKSRDILAVEFGTNSMITAMALPLSIRTGQTTK